MDKALARRLESAEEMPQVDCARMFQQLHSETRGRLRTVLRRPDDLRRAQFAHRPRSGVGFRRSRQGIGSGHLEAFYRAHDAPARLDLCPLTDPSLPELVNARRYTIAELNNAPYRVLDSKEPVTVPSRVQVRRGKAEEAGLFSGLVSRSFFEKGDVPEGFADMLAPLFRFP